MVYGYSEVHVVVQLLYMITLMVARLLPAKSTGGTLYRSSSDNARKVGTDADMGFSSRVTGKQRLMN